MALDLYSFVVNNHEVLIYAGVGLLVYSGAVYLRELIVHKMTQEKQGTKKGCADCLAMQMAINEIPTIKKNQFDLRSTDIPTIAESVSNMENSIKSLQGDTTKLFNLIEQSWLAQINRLEVALQTSLQSTIYGTPLSKVIHKTKKATGKIKNEKGK